MPAGGEAGPAQCSGEHPVLTGAAVVWVLPSPPPARERAGRPGRAAGCPMGCGASGLAVPPPPDAGEWRGSRGALSAEVAVEAESA